MKSIKIFESNGNPPLNYQQKNQLIELENNWDKYKHLCPSVEPEEEMNDELLEESNNNEDSNDNSLEGLTSAFATFNPNITDF